MRIISLHSLLILVLLQLLGATCFSENEPAKIFYDDSLVRSAVGILKPSQNKIYIALYDVDLSADDLEVIKKSQRLKFKSKNENEAAPIGYIHLNFVAEVDEFSNKDLESYTMEFSKRSNWDELWTNRSAPDGYNWTSRNLEFIKKVSGNFELGSSVLLSTAGEKRFYIKPYPPIYAWDLNLKAPVLVVWDS